MTPTPVPEGPIIDPQGIADYLFSHDMQLPDNFITKKEAQQLGWDSSYNYVSDVAPGKSIGGDYFGNYQRKLPVGKGISYREADCWYRKGPRNAYRIIYSTDRRVWYTEDHYNTFTELFPRRARREMSGETAPNPEAANGRGAREPRKDKGRRKRSEAEKGRSRLKGREILGAGGMLGLCLPLSGCYIAPDDINETGIPDGRRESAFPDAGADGHRGGDAGHRGGGNQNLFGNPDHCVTAAPDSGDRRRRPHPPGQGGWSDWGTVSGDESARAGRTVRPLPAHPRAAPWC